MIKRILLLLSFIPVLNFAQDLNSTLSKAQKACQEQNFQLAKKLYYSILEQKQSAKALMGLADCFLKLKQQDSALIAIKKALTIEPDNPEANFKLGLIYFTLNGEPQKAIPLFKKAYNLQPDSSKYALYLALSYQGLGQMQKAFELYKKIMQTDTSNPYPYYFLAEYMYELDSLPSAYHLINKAIEKNSKNYNFYLLKGSIEFKARLYQHALQSAEKGLELKPGSARLLFLKAQSLYQLQKYSQAIDILENLLQTSPSDLNIYFYLGWSYYYTGQYDKAISIAQQALKLDDKIPEFYQLLAYSYIAQNDYTKAQKAADKLLEIQPSEIAYSLKITAQLYARTPKRLLTSDHKFTKFNALNLNYIKQQANDPKSPYFFNKLMNAFKNNPHKLSLDQYFMLYAGYKLNHSIERQAPNSYIKLYKQGKYQECIAQAQKAIEQYPLDQPAYLYMASAYRQLGDIRNFLKYLTVYHGIQKAIVATGDGMTKQTSYIITNKDDIYYILDYTTGNPQNALSFGISSDIWQDYKVFKIEVKYQPTVLNQFYFLLFE